MLGVRQAKTVRRDLPVARAGRDPYIQPLRRFGLLVASIGLIVGETETVLPDPRLMGMMVVQMLRDVKWGALDVLLVDLPPGSGEPLQTLAQSVQIDGAVIVTTPQDLSLLDAGRSLGLFRKAHIPLLGVVENMSHLVCPHCGEPVEVFLRTDRPWALTDAGLEVLGRIPLSADVSRGIDAGHPLVQAAPDAALATPFRALAARVAEKLRAD
jgi:ATP-binding protein involved in chromosome partitioning